MKILALILSIIILALTVMPCVDEPCDNVLQKNEMSQGTNHNHQNEPDHCSPFCTCQCCQANFFVSNFIVIATPISINIVHFEVTPDFQSIELFDFFIPPKA